MKKTLCLLFLLSLTYFSIAQTADISLVDKYANEKRVILNKQETYYLSVKNDLPTASRDYVEEILVIDPTIESNGTAEIHFNTFSQITDIQGETQIGKKRTKIDLYNDVETHDIMLNDIFYSGYKKKTVHFKRLSKGATTKLAYKEVFTKPRMMPTFSVGEGVPLLSTELKIVTSNKVHLGYKIFNNDDKTIEVTETKTGSGEKTYTFKAKNVEKMSYESGSPSYSYIAPHVIFYIKGYETSQGYKSFLESDKDLYSWYSSLVANINKKDETELQAITTEVIKDKATDKEKAIAIFNWVQQKIKYVAFEDGMGGFIPREAADVCSKRYGDCKDMANILNQMMTFAKLNSYLVWIGTRNRPYSYKEVPTPAVDNHMIAAVRLNDEVIFLDATGQYVPFGYPTPFIQGKEAMVNLGEEHKIIKVPEMSADANLNINTIDINIEDDVLKCTGKKELKGYSKMSFLHRYDAYANEEDDFWKYYLSIGNNKFELGSQTHKLNTYEDKNIEIDYDFTLASYARKVGNRILLNPHLHKTGWDLLEEDRKTDYEFRYKRTHEMHYSIAIPKGYTVNNLPSNSEMKNNDVSYTITYKQEGDKIWVDVVMANHSLVIKKENQAAYNEIVEALKKAQKKNIMFVQVSE